MDKEETKMCSNCKREIPSTNYTIHTVHCARNIKMCPVCKEPVPVSELDDHHEKLHKLLPCKQCGESVCGTDLEDHVRDSCAHTIKSCRYCELELPRRDLPPHEGYCGARTEQCPECREFVMIKYRQLHIDSNHGFLRLDDDPVPQPKKDPPRRPNHIPVIPKINPPKPAAAGPRTEIRYYNGSRNNGAGTSRAGDESNGRPIVNGLDVRKEGNNNPSPQGAVKKRPAPKPPRSPAPAAPAPPRPPADPRRELALESALRRHREERRQRDELNMYNLAMGLPPVLTAADKLEKLRKMDALHNREHEEPDYRNILQGRVWGAADVPAGHVLGSSSDAGARSPGGAGPPSPGGAQPPLGDLTDLKPMTPEQFLQRFSALQVGGADRFTQIKSSLQELRRGLNEVTAPYNSNNSPNNSQPSESSSSSSSSSRRANSEKLPCEFCGKLVPAKRLVQHQTGCRPDLAQLRPRTPSPTFLSPTFTPASSPAAPPAPPPPPPAFPDPYENPVIPCEFCTESLPVYLINEHQERCRREHQLLYPD